MPLKFDTAPRPGLVSVVIPCYNARRFLSETLESALAQTYPYIEIIVVDDGSTDGTTELIRAYVDRVKAEFGPNRGASAARNQGTTLAAGEFIQYLDADDLLVPDAIERRVAALQSVGADVAYSDWEKLVENSRGGLRSLASAARSESKTSMPIGKFAQLEIFGHAACCLNLSAIDRGEDRRMEGMAADHSGCAVSSGRRSRRRPVRACTERRR